MTRINSNELYNRVRYSLPVHRPVLWVDWNQEGEELLNDSHATIPVAPILTLCGWKEAC